jgi:hypothetical protein
VPRKPAGGVVQLVRNACLLRRSPRVRVPFSKHYKTIVELTRFMLIRPITSQTTNFAIVNYPEANLYLEELSAFRRTDFARLN